MDTHYMKISEFAKVTGITRRNLLFYDKIGLLSPALMNQDNNYRYYTYQQIDTANVITVMRETGMSLKEIKEYLSSRSPARLIELLEQQKEIVQKKVQTLMQINDMLDTRISLTQSGLHAEKDISAIELKECRAIPILLGPELAEDSHILAGWYYLVQFYEFCRENQIIQGLPTGTIISKEDLLQGNYSHLSRYYHRPVCTSSCPTNSQIPCGLYVIGQEHTDYGQNMNLYTRLINYIDESKLTICGNAYEEYLLDEISTTEPEQYLLQIAIQVCS